MFSRSDKIKAEKLGKKHFLYPLAKLLERFPYNKVLYIDMEKGLHLIGVVTEDKNETTYPEAFYKMVKLFTTSAEYYNRLIYEYDKSHENELTVTVFTLGPRLEHSMVVSLMISEQIKIDFLCTIIENAVESFREENEEEPGTEKHEPVIN